MELIDLVNSAQISSNLNFPSWIPHCDFDSPALLDFFLSSHPSICSTMAFHPLWNTDHVFLSHSIEFPSNSEQDATFHCIAFDYSRSDWDGFRYHLRDIPWEDIFNSMLLLLKKWVQFGIAVRPWNNFWNYHSNCVMKYC